jgi:3-oxoacyl-[acyl-carrier-protein] synthase-3
VTGIGIVGWGMHVPERIVTNADLAAQFGLDDDWIVRRTGIRERRVVGPGETTASLAVEAGRRAIERAGLRPDQVSHLILASGTPEQPSPATSAFVQHELGTAGGAFDVNAECASFAYGMIVAAGIMALDPRPILLIGSDTHTLIADPEDRDLTVLVGDGAGAVVLAPHTESWLTAWDLGCDGSKTGSLKVPAGGSRMPATADTVRQKLHYARINGNEIFLHAVRYTVQSVRKTLQAAKVEPHEIDHLLPHQANLRIISAILEHTRVPAEKLITNIERYGNTGAASMPIALTEALDSGRIQRGERVLFAGFGAGMTWATALFEWGNGAPAAWPA